MILHNKPTLEIEEEQAAVKVIRSAWVAQGKEVEAFENEFCDFLGLPHGRAVAISSGTSALFLALWSLNAKNKKVAFPAYVCSSLRHAVAMADAKEILIDNSISSPNIDIDLLNKANPDIAIIPHMYGIPVEIDKINKNILVIEDCAQALGASINHKFVGLHGDVGIFSFYATKMITAGGQGGMVVSKNKDIIEAIKDYREFDQRNDNKIRFNFQMTDLQAAVGRVQLKKLPDFLKRREEIFNKYQLAGLNLIDGTVHNDQKIVPVRYRAIIKTHNVREIIKNLAEAGVKSIIPIEEWELLGNPEQFSHASDFCKSTVSLPIYPSLTDDSIELVISGVNKK